MKILLNPSDNVVVSLPLAKEVGLYEAVMLIDIHKEIEARGTTKDGIMMIARNEKQMREMFPYCKNIVLIRKLLDRLQNLGYLYITENVLFDDQSLWFGLNETNLRTLKSVTILSKDEIHDAHLIKQVSIKSNGNGNHKEDSHIFKLIQKDFMKVCHWDGSINLTPRDWAELNREVKSLIEKYHDREIINLRLMLLGIDIYRRDVLKQTQPYRPSGVARAWGSYSDYCRTVLNNNPPDVPKEWL